MFYASLTFVAGVLMLLLARSLSKHYIVASMGNQLIPTYGFFQAGAHIVGLAIFLSLMPSSKFLFLFLFFISFVCFPAAALSARIVCGMTDYWDRFIRHPIEFIFKADRYSAFGGVIGGLLSYLIAILVFHLPTGLWVIDAFCFGFIGGEIFGRIGCHANGCCYGKPVENDSRASRLLQVKYTNKLQKAVWHGGHAERWIYAAPLCMAFLNLLLICLLLALAGVTEVPAGFLGGLGLMLYPYCRLINDLGLRADRQGMGKSFTYIFLPVLFAWGFYSILQFLRSPVSTPFTFNPANLKDPYVIAVLIFDYLALLVIYGGGVEFSKKDVVLRETV
jgi:prolipoprotein diacylglyceryltransferase